MGLLAKIWGFIKSAVKGVRNRYEAAYQRWGERSLLGTSLQDARFDVDTSTRQDLQSRHRHWVANSPLVQRIRNLFIQFSVGVGGLQVLPNSSEEDWNVMRQASWDQWARRPEATTNLPLGQLCIQWAGCLFDDGEAFVHKLSVRGKPALETIEAHRVYTPVDLRDDKSIIDGIKYEITDDGGIGRPLIYYVAVNSPLLSPVAGLDSGWSTGVKVLLYKPIPAADMIHIFKARRPGQLRGIPEGFSGMNTTHDYEDLHLMEMQVAKMAAQIGNVETNPTGEIDTQQTRQARLSITTQNEAGTVITKPGDQFYNVVLGSHKISLKAGDSLKQFQVDRPSIATQNYWDLKMSEICCAYNVPKLLVVPYSLQGTVTRADLDICANAFRFNFEILAWALRSIWEWQSNWAVRFDRSMDGTPPQNFLDCVIRPPRAPNVDIGYTAQALQIELQMGTRTIQDVYAERQQDWRHQIRQIGETEAFIDQVAEEFGVTPERISQKLKQSLARPPQEEESAPAPGPGAGTAAAAHSADVV